MPFVRIFSNFLAIYGGVLPFGSFISLNEKKISKENIFRSHLSHRKTYSLYTLKELFYCEKVRIFFLPILQMTLLRIK